MVEPIRDLLVWIEKAAERIQVKTTSVKRVIDGDFDYYLIPVAAMGV